MANNSWVWDLFSVVDESAQEPKVKCKHCPYTMTFSRTRSKDIVSRSLVSHVHGHHPELKPKPAEAISKGPQFNHWVWDHFTLTEDRMATCNYCGHQLKHAKGASARYLMNHATLKHGKTGKLNGGGTVPSATPVVTANLPSTSSTTIEAIHEETNEGNADAMDVIIVETQPVDSVEIQDEPTPSVSNEKETVSADNMIQTASLIIPPLIIIDGQRVENVGSQMIQNPEEETMDNGDTIDTSPADQLNPSSRAAADSSTDPSEETINNEVEHSETGEDSDANFNQLVDSVVGSVLDFQSRSDKLTTLIPDLTPLSIKWLEKFPNSIEAKCLDKLSEATMSSIEEALTLISAYIAPKVPAPAELETEIESIDPPRAVPNPRRRGRLGLTAKELNSLYHKNPKAAVERILKDGKSSKQTALTKELLQCLFPPHCPRSPPDSRLTVRKFQNHGREPE